MIRAKRRGRLLWVTAYTPGSCRKSGYNLPERRQAKEGPEKRGQTVLLLHGTNFSMSYGGCHGRY